MESRHTTNNCILLGVLLAKMRLAFSRSEEYLERLDKDKTIERRLQVQQIIQDATPQQLGQILEALRAGKMGQTVAG